MKRTTTALIALTITVLAIPTITIRGVTTPRAVPAAPDHQARPAPWIDSVPRSIDGSDATSEANAEHSEPTIDLVGGVVEQVAVVEQAIERFQEVGLDLPQVTIHLHSSKSPCRGFQGVFNLDGSGHRVDVCNSKPMTVLHELAHLWEHHNATDPQRQALMNLQGATEWSSLDEDWTDRGIEIAAEVIAGGLLELPLVRAQLEDAPLKAESFRIITGLESPRFEEGLARLAAGA